MKQNHSKYVLRLIYILISDQAQSCFPWTWFERKCSLANLSPTAHSVSLSSFFPCMNDLTSCSDARFHDTTWKSRRLQRAEHSRDFESTTRVFWLQRLIKGRFFKLFHFTFHHILCSVRKRLRLMNSRDHLPVIFTTSFGLLFGPVATCSILRTVSMPSMTFPKTVCFPSRKSAGAVVMKNWMEVKL